MPINAKILGYLGLIPFIFFALHELLSLNLLTSMQASMGFIQYSAIILSFFGGVHWYQALCEPKNNHQIYVAMLPSIVAWSSLFLFDIKITLFVLSVSYLLILMYDKFTLSLPKTIIIEYTKMRLVLTTVVISCHFGLLISI
jgi:hypothetical protein